MISLKPDEDQHQLIEGAAKFLKERMPAVRLRGLLEPSTSRDHALWPELGELGLFSVALSEAAGGGGLGIAEEALLCRELGRVVVSPSAISTTIAAHLAVALGNVEMAGRIAGGRLPVGLAIPECPLRQAQGIRTRVRVFDGCHAELILLIDENGAGLVRREKLRKVEAEECIDWTLALGRAELCVSDLAWIDRANWDAPARARLLIAAVLCGLAEGAMDLGIEYVKVREQFGQPLGAFQAVKHRCADMAKRGLAAWSQTCFAALMQESGSSDAQFQTIAATMIAGDAAILNAEASVQNFGAMGFTAENLVHLFLKRAHVFEWIAGGAMRLQREFMAEANPVVAG